MVEDTRRGGPLGTPVGQAGPVLGGVVWWSLRSPDVDASARFWGALVGWETAPMEPWGLLVRHAGRGVGMLTRTDVAPADAGTVLYVEVDDLTATLARVLELGGTVLGEPAPDDDSGRFVHVRDSAGATVGLWAAVTT